MGPDFVRPQTQQGAVVDLADRFVRDGAPRPVDGHVVLWYVEDVVVAVVELPDETDFGRVGLEFAGDPRRFAPRHPEDLGLARSANGGDCGGKLREYV